jgi:cytochrome c peroxidase
MRRCFIGVALGLVAVTGCSGGESEGEETDVVESAHSSHSSRQRRGSAETLHSSGSIDTTNPFFLSLGVNGRSCATCHDGRAGWTITTDLARQLFRDTDGLDPLFRPHDGANRPDADVSTVAARRTAYSMALTRATTRFTRTIPATAEFTVDAVDDPYGWSTPAAFSSFRRPNSVANIAKQVAITWTGVPAPDLLVRLQANMNGATKGHALRTTDVPVEQQLAGAQFMLGLSFAQASDREAGRLDAAGALGGPANVAATPFYVGINALGGDVVTGAPFENESSKIFAAWKYRWGSSTNRARAQIARGEKMFNELEFDITGVAGLNDALGQPVVKGTCTTCHNSPNIGGQSEFRLMNTGVADGARRTPDMPLVTVRNKVTGEIVKTMDLGRATGSGLWADIGKFKAPTLRGVGSRAPYFHDGSADDLREVLKFYKQRFGVKFRGNEDDLLAFLEAL